MSGAIMLTECGKFLVVCVVAEYGMVVLALLGELYSAQYLEGVSVGILVGYIVVVLLGQIYLQQKKGEMSLGFGGVLVLLAALLCGLIIEVGIYEVFPYPSITILILLLVLGVGTLSQLDNVYEFVAEEAGETEDSMDQSER